MAGRQAEALTPRAIVEELDRYIVGQRAAKRAVAIALRNRWRRQQVPEELRDEIAPKNIIMIGPTGVGKTEIARRLAKLVHAPFLKVEASKFTEVGYVGRDVDSIVRDLIEISVKLVKDEEQQTVRARAREHAEERLLDLLLPPAATPRPQHLGMSAATTSAPLPVAPAGEAGPPPHPTRVKLRELLRAGKLHDRQVEVEVSEQAQSFVDIFGGTGLEEMVINLKDMIPGGGRRTRRRRVRVPEAWDLLEQEEAQKLIDMEKVVKEAVHRAENAGIVFIDELDKVAGQKHGGHGPDVSREGVQRDLLPIVEGSTVTTKHGPVRTDHVLFIAAGAFHVAKPSDLIPELQGRFPIRVELEALKGEDFVRILTEPENSLVRQYTALLATEGIELSYTDGAVREIARLAALVNERTENIGARRLHTVMERLLDELSFEAPLLGGQTIQITEQYVRDRLSDVAQDEDLSKYIL
jgi:ATP-dependent HslUV protease ATP-binding subunit HslU